MLIPYTNYPSLEKSELCFATDHASRRVVVGNPNSGVFASGLFTTLRQQILDAALNVNHPFFLFSRGGRKYGKGFGPSFDEPSIAQI